MIRSPLIAILGLSALAGCSDEPARPPAVVAPGERPRHRATIAIYNGTPGDATSCSHRDGPGSIQDHGRMTCGYAGKSSELTWNFTGRRGDQDVYLFTRKYPSDAPNAALTSREAAFSGERIILFQDAAQTILIEGPAAEATNP